MGSELAGHYRAARERLSSLVSGLSPEELALACPATPGWTVQDVLAHVVSNPIDGLAGRLSGPPSPEFTAEQVARWAGRPVGELLAAWAEAGPPMDDVLDAVGDPLAPVVVDVLTHEQDIRGAVGLPRLPNGPELAWAVERLPSFLAARFDEAGLPCVRVDTEHRRLQVGGGADGPQVSVEGFELFRAVLGRRSARQVAAWPWSGDPSAHLAVFFVFGPRADDLVE